MGARSVSSIVAAVALAAVLLGGGGSLPASAAPADSVQVSIDGVRFGSTLPTGLFPSSTVLIPGSSETATLYVKNDSTVPAVLVVSARDIVASSPTFAKALTLRASSTGGPAGTAVPLDGTSPCLALLVEPLAPGAVTRLAVTLAMSDVDGRVAQGESLTADLGVALRETAAGVTPAAGCDLSGVQLPVLSLPDESWWDLALTSSALLYPALMAFGALVGVGTLLLLFGRRKTGAR